MQVPVVVGRLVLLRKSREPVLLSISCSSKLVLTNMFVQQQVKIREVLCRCELHGGAQSAVLPILTSSLEGNPRREAEPDP